MWTWLDELEQMRNEMDKMFRDFPGQRLITNGKPEQKRYRCPVVNQYAQGKNIVTEIELPGVDKNDVELRINDDSVEVKVDHKQESESKDEKKGTYRYEAQSQSFYRRIPFPTPVDSKHAKAIQKDGVLRIEAPKLQIEDKSGRPLQIG